MSIKKKRFTAKQMKLIRLAWRLAKIREADYYANLGDIERVLSQHIGVEDTIFFHSDNEMVGVGTADRTYKLLKAEELELCTKTKKR